MTRVIEGQLSASGMRVGIVVARFNAFITEPLLSGAVDAFVRHGGRRDDITVVWVPGSYELPLACQRLAESGKVDGVAALGAVIRGATTHYDLVCGEAAGGIARASLATGVPITFGVITTDTIEQAIERAGTKAGNKGTDAMLAVIEMISVLRELGREGR